MLREWSGKVALPAASAGRVYVFFNNHPGGHAALNAVEFRALVAVTGRA